MTQEQAMLNVTNDPGVRRIMRTKVLGGSHRRYVGVGDTIKITIRGATPCGKVKGGDVLKTIVVRTKEGVRRPDDSVIRFDGNAYVILNNNSEQPIGTRISGPVAHKLCNEKFMKIIFLASEVL